MSLSLCCPAACGSRHGSQDDGPDPRSLISRNVYSDANIRDQRKDRLGRSAESAYRLYSCRRLEGLGFYPADVELMRDCRSLTIVEPIREWRSNQSGEPLIRGRREGDDTTLLQGARGVPTRRSQPRSSASTVSLSAISAESPSTSRAGRNPPQRRCTARIRSMVCSPALAASQRSSFTRVSSSKSK